MISFSRPFNCVMTMPNYKKKTNHKQKLTLLCFGSRFHPTGPFFAGNQLGPRVPTWDCQAPYFGAPAFLAPPRETNSTCWKPKSQGSRPRHKVQVGRSRFLQIELQLRLLGEVHHLEIFSQSDSASRMTIDYLHGVNVDGDGPCHGCRSSILASS